MIWTVAVARSAERELDAIDEEETWREAWQAVTDLEDDPFPPGSVELRGRRNHYRIRVAGQYRILYQVNERDRRVLVYRVAIVVMPTKAWKTGRTFPLFARSNLERMHRGNAS